MAVLITPPNLDSLPPPPPSLPRWTVESAWKWYNAQPYLCGANFIPSNAINQLEMWQAETFDPTTIERELHWASQLGFNVMRVYLHDLLWEHDSAGFCARIDKFLTLASRYGIRTLLVLFDDCWNSEFALGPQPAQNRARTTPAGCSRRAKRSSTTRMNGRAWNATSKAC